MNDRKVCKRGLNDIWINEYDGKVRMCGWSNYYIGNLMENTIEEIWRGKKAEEFRKSMLDGSYRYCNHSKCPYCANNELEKMLVDYNVPQLPTYCSLSYQLQCNYKCKFCRTKIYQACDCERENYKKIENEVKKLLPSLKTLSSNGAGEFFCSNSIIDIMANSDIDDSTEIVIETNGSLFTEKNWKKIERLGSHNLKVYVTVHSFNEDTYQYLSGTELPVSLIKDNLEFISNLRNKGIINEFEIATVICERNFREMPDFVQTCLNEYSMDKIRLRFFEPYGVMDLSTEWFYDVRNEFHPYHDEFEKVMSNSIFKNKKVWMWQGDTKSLQKENPYYLEKKTMQSLTKLMILPNIENTFNEYLKENGYFKVALYGEGNVGKAYRKLLSEYGVNVDVVFDTFAQTGSREGYRVERPSRDKVNQYDIILITSDTFAEPIYEELSRSSYKGKTLTMSCLVSELDKSQKRLE